MNDDTITIDLSSIEPVSATWSESSTTTNFIAQEIVCDPYDVGMDTMGSIDLTNIGLINGITTSMTNSMAGPSTIALNSGISIGNLQIGASNPGYTISTPYDDMETRLARLEKIIAEEDEVRKNHPAVQMAYDEYRLLYILAKKNTGDYLTDE